MGRIGLLITSHETIVTGITQANLPGKTEIKKVHCDLGYSD